MPDVKVECGPEAWWQPFPEVPSASQSPLVRKRGLIQGSLPCPMRSETVDVGRRGGDSQAPEPGGSWALCPHLSLPVPYTLPSPWGAVSENWAPTISVWFSFEASIAPVQEWEGLWLYTHTLGWSSHLTFKEHTPSADQSSSLCTWVVPVFPVNSSRDICTVPPVLCPGA